MSRVLVRAVAPLTRSRVFAIRHAVISLGRPGNQTRVVLMSVGHRLLLHPDEPCPAGESAGGVHRADRPQRAGPRAHRHPARTRSTASGPPSRPTSTQPPRLVPMMRARVVGRRRPARDRWRIPTRSGQQGKLTREFGITFRDALQDNENADGGLVLARAALTPTRCPTRPTRRSRSNRTSMTTRTSTWAT